MVEERSVSESLTEQAYVVRPQHINGTGRLFGGCLMQWMDELAGVVSRRHCGMEVTTAAIDQLNFKAGAYQNDTIVLIGKMTYVGESSMEVRIDVYKEDYNMNRKSINRAYFVMVAVDDSGVPVKVPRLQIRTPNEKIEWEGGKKRYILRKDRRREGY